MSDAVASARRIVAVLAAHGVREAVLCPGSRSAPLAFALAARTDLRLHVRVDERSAGYLALGLAKASGRPVAVMTTSGTAVGNLLPAVMEASHACVPLVVVSADRPSWLVGTGANQTTDQIGLFGTFVRGSLRVSDTWPTQAIDAHVARLVALASGVRTRLPGPVHLNTEFAEPLVPDGTEDDPIVAATRLAALGAGPATVLPVGPRTVIVAGDATPEHGRDIAALAARAGLPLIAEPTSNARQAALSAGSLLLASPLGVEVERVILAGHPTLTRPVNRLLARADVEVIAWTPSAEWPDPGLRAAIVADALELARGDASWLARWQEADARLASALDRGAAPGLTGRTLVRTVLAHTSGPVVLGSSALIRDADLLPADARPTYANRGLAGIDGTIATAVGIALDLAEPVTLLCGDLTALHDLNGLAIGPGEPRPTLRIIVGDDHGGSIFRMLEPGAERFAGDFERLFATPTGVDLVAAAAGYGVHAERIGSVSDLEAALARPVQDIEVLVVDVDSSGRRAQAEEFARLATQLAV